MKKKFISFIAVATIMFTGAGGLSTLVNEAATNLSALNASISSTVEETATKPAETTQTTRTEKGTENKTQSSKPSTVHSKKPSSTQSTQSKKPSSTQSKKPNSTQTKKPSGTQSNSTISTQKKKQETSTNSVKTQRPSAYSSKYMKDIYGNAISDDSLMFRSVLDKSLLNLYDIIKKGCEDGEALIDFDKGYTFDEMNTVICAVEADNPHMTWALSYAGAFTDDYGNYDSMYISYDTSLREDKEGTLAAMDKELQPLYNAVSQTNNEAEKVQYVHDWLTYNVNDGSAGSVMGDSNHTAYGAIVNKSAVCEGYCKAFVYIMQKIGMKASLVSGTTWDGGAHSWVLVQVGGEWYECDVYWDDLMGDSEQICSYRCFMRTTDELKACDSYNGVSRERYDFDGSSKLPQATGSTYTYKNYLYQPQTDFSNFS